MTPSSLNRFLFYSILLHLTGIASFVLAAMASPAAKKYYSVDFMGGLSGGGAATLQPSNAGGPKAAEPAPAKEDVKTKAVNTREDLLLKSKKKPAKKEKEVISEVPAPPSIPVPKPIGKTQAQGGAADSVSAIPQAAGSGGVGIGFGDGGPGGTGGTGTGNFPYTWYVHTIKKKLDENWNITGGYPTRIYAQVAFTIQRGGMLKEIEIEESSKNDLFDREALRAVEYSGPFPPLPSGFQEPELRVHVRFTVKR